MKSDSDRVEAQLASIRERVTSRHAGRDRSAHLHAELPIDEASRLAKITAHWGIAPSWPIGGRFEVLAKRTMRIMLRWYVNPIVEQQNEFNAAMLRCYHELESRVEAIQADLHESRGRSSNSSDLVT